MSTNHFPTSLEELDTPALIVDAARYEYNVARCFAALAGSRVTVRPHLKTAKTPIVARYLLEHGAQGICVAKLGEAEIMAAHGIDDILITTEIVGAPKVARLMALLRDYPQVKTVVDSLDGAQAIDRAAGGFGVRVQVLLDVNVGQNRCGVQPERAAVFAQQVQQLSNLELIGVQGYEGHLQHLRDPEDRRRQARAAMDRLALAVAAIRHLGIAVPVVTTGGTGTSVFCAEHPLVTEVQPGSFIFMDSDYLATGGLPFMSALTVLATVISAASSDRVVIDAGHKSLSMDSGFAQPKNLSGWRYEPAGDEHGLLIRDPAAIPTAIPTAIPIPARDPAATSNLSVGDRIELIPSHIDTTVNLHDAFMVQRDGVLEACWPIVARGKVQ